MSGASPSALPAAPCRARGDGSRDAAAAPRGGLAAKPGFRRSFRAPGAAGAARRRSRRRRRCCCCWAGGCSAPRPPRVSPVARFGAAAAARPTRAPRPPLPGRVPVSFPALSLNLPHSQSPTLLLSLASVDPPSSSHRQPRPHLHPHPPCCPQPQPQLGRFRPAWGAWETDIPARGWGAPGFSFSGFSCSSLPAPQVPGFPPINFPGALPPPPPPDSGWHTGPGGWKGMARPLPVSASAGSALPAPAHFLVNAARAPARAVSRLRPPPPPQVSPSPRRSGLAEGGRSGGRAPRARVPRTPCGKTQVGAGGC